MEIEHSAAMNYRQGEVAPAAKEVGQTKEEGIPAMAAVASALEGQPVGSSLRAAPSLSGVVVQLSDAKRAAASVDAQLSDMMGDAPFCDQCGHVTVRNGACYRCLNCGNSMGCS